jgi:hypothetical protein
MRQKMFKKLLSFFKNKIEPQKHRHSIEGLLRLSNHYADSCRIKLQDPLMTDYISSRRRLASIQKDIRQCTCHECAEYIFIQMYYLLIDVMKKYINALKDKNVEKSLIEWHEKKLKTLELEHGVCQLLISRPLERL